MTTTPLDLDAVRAALAKMTPGPWQHSAGRAAAIGNATERVGRKDMPRMVFGGAEDADRDGIVLIINAAPALLARIEALEAGLLEACDVAETVCAEVTAYTDRGNPRIIDDDEARGEIARLRALVRP